MPLRSDIPITDESQDLFSRKPLTDIIIKAIREYASYSTNCITIGLYGAWGEGKTSVMNIVRNRLEQLKYKDRLLISCYNPWLIKDQESMLVDFFKTIMYAGLSRKALSFVKQYGNMIAYIAGQASKKVAPLSGDTISAIVSKIINGLPGNDLSLAECKERISAQLKKEKRHLIVFIDDLDRLDNQEIHTVFRLIKQVADFDNVIYLVAMDVDRVSEALGTEKLYGTRFIDKIIQIPITLPKLQRADLFRELRGVLSELGTELDIDNDKLDVELVASSLIDLVRNERDITRFYNTLILLLPSVKNELNLNDFCRLEFLNVYNSKIYNDIYKKKAELLRLKTDDIAYLDTKMTDEKIQERFNATISEFSKQYGNVVSGIVTKLFRKYSQGDIETSYERTRINREEFFDRYFIRDYQEGSIPHSEVSILMSNILNLSEEETASTINRWLEISDPLRTFAALDDVIIGDDKSQVNRTKRIKAVVAAIFSSNLPEKLNFNKFEGNIYAARILSWMQQYMCDTDDNGRRKYLYDEINEALRIVFQKADLLFCLECLVYYNRSFEEPIYITIFSILKERLIPAGSDKSYEEIIKYSRANIQAFFVVWNKVDSGSMHDTMQKWLRNKEFCSEAFIRRFIDSDSALIYDLELFVALFESEAETYMNHLGDRLGTDIKDDFYRKVLANWKTALENNRFEP